MAEKTKSPIKDRPLRHAGQSLEEEHRQLVENKVQEPLLFALFMFILAALEWWRWWTDQKPSPALYSVVAFAAVAYAVFRVFKVRGRLRDLSRGIDGERAVGQFLERLRADGYEVFHDIVAPGFNVDHVLIGPAGVFSVETKTWSKPARGSPKVTYDGQRVLVDGHEPDRDPVTQARAQAAWLRELLTQSTGKRYEVRSVVLFPGWFVEQRPDTRRDVWLLEPKALPAFLQNEPLRLDASAAKMAGYHLSRFVRGVERERER